MAEPVDEPDSLPVDEALDEPLAEPPVDEDPDLGIVSIR